MPDKKKKGNGGDKTKAGHYSKKFVPAMKKIITQAEKQKESETTRKGKRMLDYQPQTQKKKNGGYSYQDFLDL
tara:strand:- start:1538 stop:1756 length:219 start_codon:yes stop_codon:yes gene_type:complete